MFPRARALPVAPPAARFHILTLVIAVAIVIAGFPARPTSAGSPVGVRGERFVDASGQEVFLLGANYEGPADRAWQMWDEGRFDSNLIRQDFERARAAGISVLRVFLQQSLANDIREGRWTKIDGVLNLADRTGLRLIFTFADYSEGRLSNLTAVDKAVASRYRGRQTILAYDLKNEPRFGDLALSEYPNGVYVGLQDPSVIALAGGVDPARGDCGPSGIRGRERPHPGGTRRRPGLRLCEPPCRLRAVSC